MEFNFKINDVSDSVQVLKIGHTLTAVGHEKNQDLQNKMALIIDEMGRLSAISQELHTPITSADRLMNSDQVLYMLTEHNTPQNFAVVGILKMGWKKLYVYNKVGSQSEEMVYCLLDFYIHESRQRKGYGKFLINFMLKDMNLEARKLAIDKPTSKLLQFMWKHFQLSKLVNQGNNFVIYEEFFDGHSNGQNHENSGIRASGYKQQPSFGRHGAHKHHDTMGEIVQGEGDAAFVKFKYNQDSEFVDHQFKEKNPHPESSAEFQAQFDGHFNNK